MEKNEMRREILSIRNDVTAEKRKEISAVIHERLFVLEEYKNADTVFIYISFGSEVETEGIIRQCAIDGKKVAVPKTGKNGEMDFILIDEFEHFIKSNFGVLEPKTDKVILPDEKTLILAPGVVFSEDCYRIGYGKGYYDKYLVNKKYLSTIGLAFSFQMVKNIKNELHDMRLKKVLTEVNLWEA